MVIVIHELGHFIAAKKAGILCHEFSLGMGPVLWSTKKGETTYSIRAIPIGGYVAMAGEELNDELVKVGNTVRVVLNNNNNIVKIILDHNDLNYEKEELIYVETVDLKGFDMQPLYINGYAVARDAFYVIKGREIQIAPAERSFNYKNKWQRFLAIFSGPFMNFVLAFFLFTIISLFIGFPNMESTEIGYVEPTYPAGESLKEGDIVHSVDGTRVYTWEDMQAVLDDNKTDRLLEFMVIRDGVEQGPFYITPLIYFYSIGFHSDIDTTNDLIIGEVSEGTLADDAGFQEGDLITKIDQVNVSTWLDVANLVEANSTGLQMVFTVERDGVAIELSVFPYNTDLVESQLLQVVDSKIGINPTYESNFIRSLGSGFTGIKNSSTMIFTTIRLLFNNDQVGIGELAGPLGIYQITASALSGGFISLLGWVALLSVNLGVINLLPIPALDGGRLVFLGYEAVTGRKPNQKLENTLHYVMYLMLMGLFVFITYNDIVRLLKTVFN